MTPWYPKGKFRKIRLKLFSLRNVCIMLVTLVLVKIISRAQRKGSIPVLTSWKSTPTFLSPSEFQLNALFLFRRVELEKERFWLAQSNLKKTSYAIPIDKVLVQDNAMGPDDIYHDPRYTLSVYLKELQRLGKSKTLPTLPFHWVDWTDTTWAVKPLTPEDTESFGNQEGAVLGKDTTCLLLQGQVVGKLKYSRYCIDVHSLTDDEFAALGYRNRQQLPKALIYAHCPQDSSFFNDVRKFMAKSHAMTHLPKPYRVVILNDFRKRGTFEFDVDQKKNPEQRLLYSDMARRFLQHFMRLPSQKAFMAGGVLSIDLTSIFRNLQYHVKLHFESIKQDLPRSHDPLKQTPGSRKAITLQGKHFHYPPEMIPLQIKQYEELPDRSVAQQSFLDGLKECQKYKGETEPVYFKRPVVDMSATRNSPHEHAPKYDWRFFNDALFYEKPGWTEADHEQRINIIRERLLRNWSRFTAEKGLISWLDYAPLLAWHWSGVMSPHDGDLAVRMPITELVQLARVWNQTLVVELPSEGYGKYLIDVSTFIHNRDRSTQGNHIDARFIDVDSGVYIEISGLAKARYTKPKMEEEESAGLHVQENFNAEVYIDRHQDGFALLQLLPLRYSMLNGVPVYIPQEIEPRLHLLYGERVTRPEYHGWHFVNQLQLWISRDKLLSYFEESDYADNDNHFDVQKFSELLAGISDEKALELLQDDTILSEYYLTCKYTDWHAHEKIMLLVEQSEHLKDMGFPEVRRQYNRLVEKIRFSPPLRPSLFEYETFDQSFHHWFGNSENPTDRVS